MSHGKNFAFVVHTVTNLYLAIFGMIAYFSLYFYNKNRRYLLGTPRK